MCSTRLPRFCGSHQTVSLPALLVCAVILAQPHTATGQDIVRKLESATERVELMVNSSRILTLDKKIPQAQVNNPEMLVLTPLSPNQIQISAKKPGVTQVNLWDDQGKVYSVDVLVLGDVKELQLALKTQFPHSSVKVYRYSNSLVLSGFVDRPDNVSRIVRLSEDYAPKVINNISVGGVQQVLLHVKVMEVSRTKLRGMGFDFAQLNGNDFVVSSISGLITEVNNGGSQILHTNAETLNFGIVDGDQAFLGLLEMFRQHDLMKILAEPTLTTVSGRPASFNVGGEFPILVPQSLGTVSIEYKKFGTQIDFVPIVLGNGNIRLEVRPRVSEIDATRSVEVDGTTVPGLRVREVDTGVEMKAGQTLALAGLIQNRTEAQNRGVPFLADLPWIGAAFRRVEEKNNEIELLIMVRPEFAGAMDPHEVPPGGPGLDTVSPSNHELYWRGYMEVPRCCADGSCDSCQSPGPIGGPNGQVIDESLQPPDEPLPPESETSYQTSRRASSENPARSVSVGQAQHTNIPSHHHNRSDPNDSSRPRSASRPANPPGLIGPVGYDVEE